VESSYFLRGHYYDTKKSKKCSRFHPCVVTQKCQNYNRHCQECFICEQRIYPPANLGGMISEGENVPDVQLATIQTQYLMAKAFNSPDAEAQIINGSYIEAEYWRQKERNDILASAMQQQTEEQVWLTKEQIIKGP
jgi:hypothetical protein